MIQTFTDAEDALLRAALRDGDAALEAFAQWRALFDFEGQHEAGQFRLLPLLHANMARLGCKDPVMARLRGVHRHAWAEGQRRQYAAAIVLRVLAGAAIPTLVTKGLALARDYYPDLSLRPMQDMDLMVPRDRAEEAVAVLQDAGWRFITPQDAYAQGGAGRAAFMILRHGLDMVDGSGNEADLHWRPLFECAVPDFSDWFWQGAEPLSISGEWSLRPQPGPLLFHVVSHGLQPNVISPLRWVADASMILKRSGSDIDWDMFWNMARRVRNERRLAEGLAIVERISASPLPAGARRQARATLVEQLEINAQRGASMGELRGLPLLQLRLSRALRLWSEGGASTLLLVMRQWLRRPRGVSAPE
jgi:hypothetical protein